MSKQVLDVGDAIIVLVEACPCNNKEELKAKEAYYINRYDCTNKQVPGRTRAEYHQDNKARLNDISQEYHRTHKVQQNANRRLYRLNNLEREKARERQRFNCPCGGKYSRTNKSSHMKTVKHQTWAAAN
jgi:hypothetical protein